MRAYFVSVLRAVAVAVAAIFLSGCQTDGRGSPGGWQVLFDGTSTAALRGYREPDFPAGSWVVEGGALKTVPGKPVDLITRDAFENYELEVEWKVSPAGNSGIIYNVSESEPSSWHTGPELQVLDDTLHPDGRNPLTTAGSLYALIAPNEAKKLRPVGEFNRFRLVVDRGHVEHWLNGRKIVEYQWGSPAVKALIARSKFKDAPKFMTQNEGHIVFQHHGEEVWFRNIRIRRL